MPKTAPNRNPAICTPRKGYGSSDAHDMEELPRL
jgi:hypothetical protein